VTIGAKHLEGGVGDPPARFGLLEPVEGGGRLLPGRSGHRRHAPRIAALLLGLRDLAGGGLSLFPESFHAVPGQAQDAPGLVGGVEDVPAVLQRGLLALAPLLLHQGDPGL
jgi:hypothetical protein